MNYYKQNGQSDKSLWLRNHENPLPTQDLQGPIEFWSFATNYFSVRIAHSAIETYTPNVDYWVVDFFAALEQAGNYIQVGTIDLKGEAAKTSYSFNSEQIMYLVGEAKWFSALVRPVGAPSEIVIKLFITP